MKEPILAAFATITEDGKPWARLVVVKADDEMNIWFATFAQSRKVAQLAKKTEAHLTLSSGDLMHPGPYIQVQAKAEILTDQETKDMVWFEQLDGIFSGPTDPMYVVCKLSPYLVEYNQPDPANPPEVWQA